MTKAEVDALIARWMEEALDEAEDLRATCGPVSENARESIYSGLSATFDGADEALVNCDYRTVTKEVDDLLTSAGLPLLDHTSVEFGRLCRRFLVAKQEYCRIEADRWEGKYEEAPALRQSAQHETPTTPPPPPGKPFSDVVQLYFQENKRAKRTDGQIRAELDRFVSLIGGGERPINLITKADTRAYKEDMLQRRGLGLATCIKHLSSLAVVFKWAEAQGFIPENSNPVRGLSPNKRQAKKQAAQRRPFTDEELVKVLGSEEFRQQRDLHPDRYWLILLCLFEICRREEAGQLALADIGEQDGIPFMRITDEGEGQGLKNEGSKRRVPIHSALIKLGFLEYVERMRNAGHSRLFPQLKKGTNGYSDAVGKFFSRLVTKAGLTDPALVLHGLRHGGITKLHGAGVLHNVVEVLAGHAAGNVHGQYVHREKLPLSLLREGLEKLQYDDVLKCLRV